MDPLSKWVMLLLGLALAIIGFRDPTTLGLGKAAKEQIGHLRGFFRWFICFPAMITALLLLVLLLLGYPLD